MKSSLRQSTRYRKEIHTDRTSSGRRGCGSRCGSRGCGGETEIFRTLELLQLLLESLINIKRIRCLAVLQESPQLLEPVKIACMSDQECTQGNQTRAEILAYQIEKVTEDVRSEMLLKTVAVVSEQTL